jgi:hypothetical protein
VTAESDRDELPIPDYDHLPIGSLQHRIRALDQDQLSRLGDYERQHANRAPVLASIQARLTALQDGARLSPGTGTERQPEAAPEPAGGSAVSPETSGPPMNPPSQGVPSNPAQPRTTG